MRVLLIFILIVYSIYLKAQFGYGLTITNDLYHRYVNPADAIAGRSSGSVLLNLGAGPKIWLGGKNISLSLEAQANIGFLGLALKDYKGLGTLSYPIMAKLNFNGLSAMDREGRLGWSIGGGIQYSKTELYGLDESFAAKGVVRKMFKTYVAQLGYGFGISGFGVQGFARYGWNRDNDANTLNIGLQWDFNAPMLKKITSPESSL